MKTKDFEVFVESEKKVDKYEKLKGKFQCLMYLLTSKTKICFTPSWSCILFWIIRHCLWSERRYLVCRMF